MEILRWPTTGLLDSAPADWEVLMLYSLGGQANDLYRSENASLWHAWTFEDKLFNTGAYLINRKGMKQVCWDFHISCKDSGKSRLARCHHSRA